MAAAVEVSDPQSDLFQLDPLDLDDINFSCAAASVKDTDEFEYEDSLFQKPEQVRVSEERTKETAVGIIPSAKVTGDGSVQCDQSNPVTEPESMTAGEEVRPTGTDHNVTSAVFAEEINSGRSENTEVCNVTLEFAEDSHTSHVTQDEGPPPAALVAAQDEWDKVECIEAGFADPSQPGRAAGQITTTPIITFNEALQHFQTMDLSHLKPEIRTSVNRSGFAALRHLLFGPAALNKELVTERDMAFCMASSSFDNDNEIHIRVLQTIYKTLTGSKFECPRYGSHFEEIGFQGNDPATDLRGGGLLGLMHILHLLTDQRILPVAREIYKLSTDETQNFPFCLMGINISRITLQAVREGCLNKECNRRKQVVAVMNDFYVGTYLHLYEIWKHQNKTIGDSGFVLKDVEHFVKKNPKCAIRKLDTYLDKRKQNSTTPSSVAESGDKIDIDNLK